LGNIDIEGDKSKHAPSHFNTSSPTINIIYFGVVIYLRHEATRRPRKRALFMFTYGQLSCDRLYSLLQPCSRSLPASLPVQSVPMLAHAQIRVASYYLICQFSGLSIDAILVQCCLSKLGSVTSISGSKISKNKRGIKVTRMHQSPSRRRWSSAAALGLSFEQRHPRYW
jgi:hypothetical protein